MEAARRPGLWLNLVYEIKWGRGVRPKKKKEKKRWKLMGTVAVT